MSGKTSRSAATAAGLRRVRASSTCHRGEDMGSRAAYGLTYTSCQQSRKFDGLYRRLAADIGGRRSSRAGCFEATLAFIPSFAPRLKLRMLRQ